MTPLTIISITMPGSEAGREFYLHPDFSKMTEPGIWAVAFGQAFFSLSVGMGVLLVYGSYMAKKTGQQRSLFTSSLIVIISDLAIAFMAGLMIFSMVFASGMAPDQGASFVFRVMPEKFGEIEYGFIFGSMFFFLLLLAGITSSISMFQVPVSTLEDTFRFSRNKASVVVAILLLGAGLPSALSYSSLECKVAGERFLDLMDTLVGTYGIVIAGALFSIAATWFFDKKKLMEQINFASPIKFPDWVVTVVKFILPALIISTMINQLLTKGI
jgi:NSS family neurotransmitter:Na+ symporter